MACNPKERATSNNLRKFQQDPRNIPQTLNYLFIKEILSFFYFEVPAFGLFRGSGWNFPRNKQKTTQLHIVLMDFLYHHLTFQALCSTKQPWTFAPSKRAKIGELLASKKCQVRYETSESGQRNWVVKLRVLRLKIGPRKNKGDESINP